MLGADRVVFFEADLIPNDLRKEATFDLITANLPYIPSSEIPTLSREVLQDPILALDGGVNGLDLVFRLAPRALECLKPGGRLLLEIGINQDKDVMNCLSGYNYRDITALPDYQGIPRFVEAVKDTRQEPR